MSLGNLLLAVFLILFGLAAFVHIPVANMVLGVVGVVAGILLLVGR
jgi:hypothetical protein